MITRRHLLRSPAYGMPFLTGQRFGRGRNLGYPLNMPKRIVTAASCGVKKQGETGQCAIDGSWRATCVKEPLAVGFGIEHADIRGRAVGQINRDPENEAPDITDIFSNGCRGTIRLNGEVLLPGNESCIHT